MLVQRAFIVVAGHDGSETLCSVVRAAVMAGKVGRQALSVVAPSLMTPGYSIFWFLNIFLLDV